MALRNRKLVYSIWHTDDAGERLTEALVRDSGHALLVAETLSRALPGDRLTVTGIGGKVVAVYQDGVREQ